MKPYLVKTVSHYACGLCHRKGFTTLEAATNCHDRGIALPEFPIGTVLRLKGLNDPTLKGKLVIVLQDTWTWADGDTTPFDVHCLPYFYDVLVSDHKTNGQNPPKGRSVMISSGFFETLSSGPSQCPICEYTELSEVKEFGHRGDGYHPYNLITDLRLECVQMTQCKRCCQLFFNSQQLTVVKEQIANIAPVLFEVQVRDTDELKRNKEYY